MFYQETVQYTEGGNIIMGAGLNLNPIMADEVPVTDISIVTFLTLWVFSRKERYYPCTFQLIGSVEHETFIGEQMLFITLLNQMIQNSTDSGADLFRMEVQKSTDNLELVVSDNGRGLPADYDLEDSFTNHTSKPLGFGYSLRFAKLGIQKMGADVTYQGVGIKSDAGPGASFVITLLRRMPE